MKRKMFLGMLGFFLVFVLSADFIFAQPELTAPFGIVIDYETGQVLYEKNANEAAYPASTTKIMTALLAIENLDLNERITLDYDLYVDGSSMYLLKGESFTVRELIQALLIRSANDVAEILANRISGSVEAFAQLMNARAAELGAKNTHFTNPHGLPDQNHVTTAYDLAIISRYAMSLPFFKETVGTVRLTLDETEQTPEKRYYLNTNRFLWATGSGNLIDYGGKTINIQYDLVDGIKTGFTNDAQQCLVASAVKDGRRVITVVLGAVGNNLYLDSRALMDYGLDSFALHTLNQGDTVEGTMQVKMGSENQVDLVSASPLQIVLDKGIDPVGIRKETLFEENIAAPVEAGAVLGKVTYYLNQTVLGEVNLLAAASVELKPTLFEALPWLKYVFYVFAAMALWQVLLAYLRLQKRKRRRSSFSYRRAGGASYQFSKGLMRRK